MWALYKFEYVKVRMRICIGSYCIVESDGGKNKEGSEMKCVRHRGCIWELGVALGMRL